MTDALHIVIPGVCPPAPRPRARVIPLVGVNRKGARDVTATVYTPKTGPYAKWKRIAQVYVERARAAAPIGEWPAPGPLEVRLLFVMPLPTSAHRKTMRVSRGWCSSLRRGDADNLAKGPLDACLPEKGRYPGLFTDDSNVARLVVEKVVAQQGEEPRTEILVRPLEAHAATLTDFERNRGTYRHSGVIDNREQGVDLGPRIPAR